MGTRLKPATPATGAKAPHRRCLSVSLMVIILASLLVSQKLLTTYLARVQVVLLEEPIITDEILRNFSAINTADLAERRKMKNLLDRSENGRYTIREVLFLTRPPAPVITEVMDRQARAAILRNRQSENAWMVKLTSRRFEAFVPTFYAMARTWLLQGDLDLGIMKELPDLVARPLMEHFRSISLGNSTQGGTPTSVERDEIEGPAAPARTHAQAKYRSCAVVGNSGILLNRSYGGMIDSHEFVIRLNNAKTQGYEQFVGAKTSLAFMNSNILQMCSRKQACACHPYGSNVPIILYICQAPHLMEVALCRSFHKSPLLITDGRLDHLCSRLVKWYSARNFVESTGRPLRHWDKAHQGYYFHYSSGFEAVVLALAICDTVSLYGFGKDPLIKHHYHTQQNNELALHDYEAEYLFYDDLTDGSNIPFLSEAGVSLPPVTIFR